MVGGHKGPGLLPRNLQVVVVAGGGGGGVGGGPRSRKVDQYFFHCVPSAVGEE